MRVGKAFKPLRPFKLKTYLGGIGTVDECRAKDGEFLYNYTFDCGVKGWGFDSSYPATITDNADGSVHLKTNSNFGSLVPNRDDFNNGNYILECNVKNIIGNGKMSIRNKGGVWHNSSFNTNGIHTFFYDGDISEIHCGADGDNTYEADYEYISLRKYTIVNNPCMTSQTTPYGIANSSGNFSASYPAYEGLSCFTSSAEAWLSPTRELVDIPDDGIARGDYIEWQLSDDDLSSGMPQMIPIRFEITPRGGMNSTWWRDRNPRGLAFCGIKTDGTVELIQSYTLGNWSVGTKRGWDISTTNKYRGFRVYVTNVYWETSGSKYGTGIGILKVFGIQAPLNYVEYNGIRVTNKGEEVFYSGY